MTRRYTFGLMTAVATYLAVQAFSTVPSPLYPLYATRDHLSSLTITLIYAAYAIGVAVSLVGAGHLSDVWGRRPVLAIALLLNMVSCAVFAESTTVGGLFCARVVCGLAVGITASTATAYLVELFATGHPGGDLRLIRMITAATAIGGLGLGALVSGVIAEHVSHPLSAPYLVSLAVFATCLVGLWLAPETHPRLAVRPRYRPQRIAVPAHARRLFFASLTGAAAVFAVFGLFVGLAGTVLGEVLGRHSTQLSGIVLAVLFGTGALSTLLTVRVGHHTLVTIAGVTMTAGLTLFVLSVWIPTPDLALFIVSGAIIGVGGTALFSSSLAVAAAVAPADRVAETMAGFYLAGYLGISVPVIGTGIALQHVNTRTTLLGFAILLTAGLAIALPVLARMPVSHASERTEQHITEL